MFSPTYTYSNDSISSASYLYPQIPHQPEEQQGHISNNNKGKEKSSYLYPIRPEGVELEPRNIYPVTNLPISLKLAYAYQSYGRGGGVNEAQTHPHQPINNYGLNLDRR